MWFFVWFCQIAPVHFIYFFAHSFLSLLWQFQDIYPRLFLFCACQSQPGPLSICCCALFRAKFCVSVAVVFVLLCVLGLVRCFPQFANSCCLKILNLHTRRAQSLFLIFRNLSFAFKPQFPVFFSVSNFCNLLSSVTGKSAELLTRGAKPFTTDFLGSQFQYSSIAFSHKHLWSHILRTGDEMRRHYMMWYEQDKIADSG